MLLRVARTIPFSTMRFTNMEVQARGLLILKITHEEQAGKSEQWKEEIFRKLYGSPPCVIRQMWDDLIDTDILECKLDFGERNHTGLRMLLISHYFLWTYPRNSRMIEAHFSPIIEKETRGVGLWHWIEKIYWLMPSRIHWLDRFNASAGAGNDLNEICCLNVAFAVNN